MVKLVQPAADARVINESLGIDWSNWDFPSHLAYSQRDMIAFWPTAVIAAPAAPLALHSAADYPLRTLSLASFAAMLAALVLRWDNLQSRYRPH